MEAGKVSMDGNNGREMRSGAPVKSAVERVGRDSGTQPTRSSSRLWNKHYLPLQVFNNDLLREKILEYAVLSGGYIENRETAFSLRLVGRNWNEMIIKLLYKNQQNLFHLALMPSEDEEKLARFCATFSSSTLVNGCIPPFYLKIPWILNPEFLTELSNLFTNCGEGIYQLRIWMLQKENQFKSEFPKWPLIHLRKMHIIIFLSQPQNVNTVEASGQDDDDGTVNLQLLKAVLRNAPTITDIMITMFYSNDMPVNSAITDRSIFEPITLPASLTNLILKGDMRTKDLESLASKSIPKLNCLVLQFKEYDSLADGLFYKLLDNFRTSLKIFSVEGNVGQNEVSIRFPVMEKLEQLSMDASNVVLRSGLHSLERSLPKVRTLYLHNLTSATLRKWTGLSKFISVTTLHFQLAQSNQLDYPNGLTMERMQSVNLAFPNVRKLELFFSGGVITGLEYLFKEMTQLTDLKLVWGTDAREINLDLWDAVLTGLPLETIARLRDSPDLWDANKLNEEEGAVSIKNLKELTSLSLFHGRPTNHSNLPALFISDIAFRFALLLMPKLRKLCLNGRFKASAEIAEEWRTQGRVIEYSKRDDYSWEKNKKLVYLPMLH